MTAMAAGVDETDSVYHLITSLCTKVLKKHEPFPSVSSKHNLEESHLRRLRSLCFGILLGKTHQHYNNNTTSGLESNPLAQLIAYSYHLHSSGERRLGCQLDQCVDEVFETNSRDDLTLIAVIQLLILLKDLGSDRNDLLNQDPFDLSRIYPPVDAVLKNSLYSAPMPYCTPSPSLFTPPHWMNCHQSQLRDRGYCERFPFTERPGESLPYLSRFTYMFQKDRVKSQPTYNVRSIGVLSGPRNLSFTLPSSYLQNSVIIQDDEGYFTPDLDKPPDRSQRGTSVNDKVDIWSRALELEEPLYRTWDSVGLPNGVQEPPYLSAAPPMATFRAWQVLKVNNNIFAEASGQRVSWIAPDSQPTSRKLFLEHAVYLLQGIESRSFLYNEISDVFVVRPGLWIVGLTPDSIGGVCEDLLICGTYFRRLERMTHKRGFHSDEGTILQALRGSLRRFVQSYRATVLHISAEMSNYGANVPFFTLIRKIQSLKQQVECLGRLYHLNPGETKFPVGVELLPYIYQELGHSMRRSQTCVLYSALTSCCEVYYRRLERWIFLGNCFHDDREEFFIRPDFQFSSQRSRLLWTKSFVLNESLVPDFLRGLETTILQCGRAVHVLRLCDPGHPLCVLLEKEHPTIRCSLQMSDLEAIQKDCFKFEAEVRRVCGDFVTVAGIFQKAREQERRVQLLIQKSNEERAIAQAAEAARLARERAAVKQAQLRDLKEQMFAAEKRHQAMVEREREEEARFLEETRKIEEMAELARQEERAKIMKYYEALNEHIQRREKRVEWRFKRLQLSGRREQFLADNLSFLREVINTVPNSSAEPTVETVSTENLDNVSNVSCELGSESSESEKQLKTKEKISGIDAGTCPDEPRTECGSDEDVVTENSLSVEAAKEAALQAGVNKRKILESEYGIFTSSQTTDLNRSNVTEKPELKEEGLSAAEEAAANKRKVLGSEFDLVQISRTADEERVDVSVIAVTEGGVSAAEEAAINKCKILGSEIGLVPTSQPADKEGVDVSTIAVTEGGVSAAEEAANNKRKVLGSEFDVVQISQTADEGVDVLIIAVTEGGFSAAEEAAINKCKVLGSEFDVVQISQTADEEQVDVSIIAVTEGGVSAAEEAAINKRKVLGSEFGIVPTSQLADTERIDASAVIEGGVPAAIEAVLNKRKVLGSEFDIVITPQTADKELVHVSANTINEGGDSESVSNDRKKVGSNVTTLPTVEKERAVDSATASLTSELENNRKRVLQEEFRLELGSSKSSVSFKDSSEEAMSERLKNKMRVMEEEFDILTGVPKRRQVRISEVPSPTAGSRSVAAPSSASGESSNEVVAEEVTERKLSEVVSTDSGFVSAVVSVAERPKELQLTASIIDSEPGTKYASTEDQISNSSSDKTYDLPRAYSIDSTLFKRTPSTPFSMTTSFGTSINVDGAPQMVDILDRFLGPSQPAPVQTPTPSDASGLADVSPSTVWLGMSLQQGLLIPLRTHHSLVSSALLQFFLRDLDLLSHLRSLRFYFFLLDGEFGRRLTSQVFTQMYQVATPAGLLNGLTLNNLLAAALSQSYSGNDPNSILLSFSVSTVPQHFSHSSPGALDCLHLHYRATWPINLILTEEALDKYNLIFVFLIRLRRVSWLLQEDFIVLKSTARQCNNQQRRDLLNSPEYHQVQIIRHCMSQFVQATQSYVTSAVLQASWTYLEQALRQATTLDHIYNAHIAYIKHVLKRCLLNQNSKRVEAVLSKVLSCVLQFHSLVRVRAWQATGAALTGQRGYLQHPNFSKMVVCFKMFKLQVCKLACYLEKLVAPPHQQTHLAEFLLLLNLKDFYPPSEYLKQVAETTASVGDV